MHVPTKLLLSAIILCFPSVYGILKNRTIDDTSGDELTGAKPTYEPFDPEVWQGRGCSECQVQPDPARAHGGTWMAATYIPEHFRRMSVTLLFTGTAIYVYFILPKYVSDKTDTATGCNFTLDGQGSGSYFRPSDPSNQMEYNALVFSRGGLQYGNHTFVISTESGRFYVNFDYAIYTFDDDPSVLPISISLDSNSESQSTSLIPSSSASGSGADAGSISTSNATTAEPTLQPSSSMQTESPLTILMPSSDGPQPSSFPSEKGEHVKAPVWAIAAVASGGAVLLLIILAVLYVHRRRQRRAMHIRAHFRSHKDFDTSSKAESITTVEIRPTRHSASPRNNTSVLAQAVSDLAPREDQPGSHQTGTGRRLRESAGEMREQNRDRTLDPLIDAIDETQLENSRRVQEELEVREMREQMRVMRERMAYLEARQHSEWTRGVLDGPPPGYVEGA